MVISYFLKHGVPKITQTNNWIGRKIDIEPDLSSDQKAEFPMLPYGSISTISRLRRVTQFYIDNEPLTSLALNKFTHQHLS